MAQLTFEVHLAVYDLSRGMARSLSGQFLGPDHALDIIPHTGLVVYGKEYFYGGGIQSETPDRFRRSTGMFPISQELIGRTTVSQAEFEQWCAQCMRMGRWTMASYDLLERNCNNFCQEAAVEGLRLPNGIPQWILDVPRRFLASPMGQLVRPMLEQMQVTGSNTAPFANAAPPVLAASTTAPVDGVASNVNNPWANLPSSTTAAASTDSFREVKVELTTPVLDSFARPLLSNDTKTASVCAKKLIASTEDENDKTSLKDVSVKLVGGSKPSEELVEASCKAVLKPLNAGANVTFALMLLRLVMLYPPSAPKETTSSSCFHQCIEWVEQQLSSSSNALPTPAARSMAWCTLSNAYGTLPSLITSLESCVESAMGDLSIGDQPRVEVRQAAAAFLYNVSLERSDCENADELPDLRVSLLCACLDAVASETDDTCRLRRLVVAAKIVKPGDCVHASARCLVNDLGFTESLREIVTSGNPNATGDAEMVQKMTAELIRILES